MAEREAVTRAVGRALRLAGLNWADLSRDQQQALNSSASSLLDAGQNEREASQAIVSYLQDAGVISMQDTARAAANTYAETTGRALPGTALGDAVAAGAGTPSQRSRTNGAADRVSSSLAGAFGGGGGAGAASDGTPATTPSGLTRGEALYGIAQGYLDFLDDADPDDFDDQYEYEDALTGAMSQYATVLDLIKSERELESGLLRMDDGTLITQAQFDTLDPMAQQQVTASVMNRNRAMEAEYVNLTNSLNLQQYQLATSAIDAENANRSRAFQNQMERYRASLEFDEANRSDALARVGRQLDGMAESRARASTVTDALAAAAPMGTGGKTRFKAGDFGAAVASIAQRLGMAPDADAIAFPGLTRIDPEGLMAANDRAAGVTGPLAAIPEMVTGPDAIPQAPGYAGYGNVPVPELLFPSAPAYLPVPGAQPRTVGAPTIASLPADERGLLRGATVARTGGVR
jgi:hypothetical protein